MKRLIARFIVYVFAFGVAVTAFYPFFVMIISSTHDSYDIVARANVLPGTHFAENYARLTQNSPRLRLAAAGGTTSTLAAEAAVLIMENPAP